jgi:uncharacterized protein with PIN domain
MVTLLTNTESELTRQPAASNSAIFRFYEELNDFLPREKQKQDFHHRFAPHQTIKDIIESLGVPHPEVELILIDGVSVDFSHRPPDGSRVAIYPMFESFDISAEVRLPGRPLRRIAFVLDVHLGKLARRLRLSGFDCLWRNDYDDAEIVAIAHDEHRCILTRDRRLLFARDITHGYWLRETDPDRQWREVLSRFDLVAQMRPFSRCPRCNGVVHTVSKSSVQDLLWPKTLRYYDDFYQCDSCHQVYWDGPHMPGLHKLLAKAKLPLF